MGLKHSVRNMFSASPMSPPTRTDSTAAKLTLKEQEEKQKNEKSEEEEEGNHVSHLQVPRVSSTRRPSTADVVIQKLQVEKVEGGGITISGISLAANCHISLMIFGVFFILAGIVLSYVGFAFTPDPESPENSPIISHPASSASTILRPKSSKTHRQMQVIGPIFIFGGLMMLVLGISLFAISSKINRDEKERRLLMSAMQLHQLENSFYQSSVAKCGSPLHTISAPSLNQDVPVLSLRRCSWWMEPTPVEDALVPSEVIPGSDCPPSYSRSESIRSPSPLLENPRTWSHQQLQGDKSIFPSPIPSLHPQHNQLLPQQQSLSHTPLRLTNKRLSSTDSSSFYGKREGSVDIATFPLENYETGNSTSLMFQNASQLISEEGGSSGDSEQRNTNRASSKGEQQATAVPLITVSSMVSGENFNSATPTSFHKQSIPTSTSVTMVASVQPVSSNFPLYRNGIAIPRHSRHCTSSKPEG